MKKIIKNILIGSLIFGILGFFIGPLFYIAPSCSLDQLTGGIHDCMGKVVSYQIVGVVIGIIIGMILGFVISKFKKTN